MIEYIVGVTGCSNVLYIADMTSRFGLQYLISTGRHATNTYSEGRVSQNFDIGCSFFKFYVEE